MKNRKKTFEFDVNENSHSNYTKIRVHMQFLSWIHFTACRALEINIKFRMFNE